MIHDDAISLVMCPADLAGGLVAAAEFAQEPIQVVSEWESGCRRTRDAVEPDDPDDATQAPTPTLINRHHHAHQRASPGGGPGWSPRARRPASPTNSSPLNLAWNAAP